MYNNKLVASIKSNNKIVREFGDIVYLKFQSEYSILLKNLDSRKASVSITIDGNDIGGALVLHPGREIELERFIGSNLNQGNKFKFIERTTAIEDHRGIKQEDGIIRIEYRFEKPRQIYPLNNQHPMWQKESPWDHPWGQQYRTPEKSILRSKGLFGSGPDITYNDVSYDSYTLHQDVGFATSSVGITAPGSISDQKFVQAEYFNTEEQSYVIVIKLMGEVDNIPIKETPIFKKQKCTMCGNVNKKNAKFCSECGAGLIFVGPNL